MCIYCGTKKYRKIYELHFGPIPKDSDGRTYDIHHIDGNHYNNSPDNLQAVTIQEHYDIHYKQEDYFACHRMSKRMNLAPEEISILGSMAQRKRVESGTHNFLGPDNNKKKIDDGTHNFLGESNPVYKRIANGTHNFLDPLFIENQSKVMTKRNAEQIANKTHHFLGGEIARKTQRKKVENGTHHFCGESNPGKMQWTCEHCGRSGKGKSNFTRSHGDNCKFRCEPQDHEAC
jgi:hypothetical protein